MNPVNPNGLQFSDVLTILETQQTRKQKKYKEIAQACGFVIGVAAALALFALSIIGIATIPHENQTVLDKDGNRWINEKTGEELTRRVVVSGYDAQLLLSCFGVAGFGFFAGIGLGFGVYGIGLGIGELKLRAFRAIRAGIQGNNADTAIVNPENLKQMIKIADSVALEAIFQKLNIDQLKVFENEVGTKKCEKLIVKLEANTVLQPHQQKFKRMLEFCKCRNYEQMIKAIQKHFIAIKGNEYAFDDSDLSWLKLEELSNWKKRFSVPVEWNKQVTALKQSAEAELEAPLANTIKVSARLQKLMSCSEFFEGVVMSLNRDNLSILSDMEFDMKVRQLLFEVNPETGKTLEDDKIAFDQMTDLMTGNNLKKSWNKQMAKRVARMMFKYGDRIFDPCVNSLFVPQGWISKRDNGRKVQFVAG